MKLRSFVLALITSTLFACSAGSGAPQAGVQPLTVRPANEYEMRIRNQTDKTVYVAEDGVHDCMSQVPPSLEIKPSQSWRGPIQTDCVFQDSKFSLHIAKGKTSISTRGTWTKATGGPWKAHFLKIAQLHVDVANDNALNVNIPKQ